MVAPEFLQNPEVHRWLGGVKPAWTMLDYGSYAVLHEEPSAGNEAIRLDPHLRETDLSGSAVARVARMLLEHASGSGGLKLTATGNLSRAVVAKMVKAIEWPGLDKSELFKFHKVINGPDFLPLYFVRVLIEGTKLLRKQRDKLVATRLGKKMLVPDQYRALHALLFHIAMWHLNLSYFDRNPINSWPQNHTGIVLWSLSAAATEWLDRETLVRLCTVPVNGVLDAVWDPRSSAMETRVLRPLAWFGLLEQRRDGRVGRLSGISIGRPRCLISS